MRVNFNFFGALVEGRGRRQTLDLVGRLEGWVGYVPAERVVSSVVGGSQGGPGR